MDRTPDYLPKTKKRHQGINLHPISLQEYKSNRTRLSPFQRIDNETFTNIPIILLLKICKERSNKVYSHMEDYIGILIFIAIVIFNFVVAMVRSKKSKFKGKRSQKLPQRTRTTKKTFTAEAIWEDLVQQAKAQIEQQKSKKTSKTKALTVPKEPYQDDKIFSYDDKYEAEGYQERRQAELESMVDKRQHGEHLKSTTREKIKQLHVGAFDQKKKKAKKKFKFNSKDAIIYDVIMNRKYK